MKVGDLVKIYPKDGAVSHVVGVFLGEEKKKISYTRLWVVKPVFLVGGEKRTYCKLDYIFEII